MYETKKLFVTGFLAVGLFVTGCSQQPLAVVDIQPVAMVTPAAIDTQVQNLVKPQAPKVYQQPPRRMVKPIQRMAKPIQRQAMAKPVQNYKMMNAAQRRMIKPIQRQSAY